MLYDHMHHDHKMLLYTTTNVNIKAVKASRHKAISRTNVNMGSLTSIPVQF